MAQIEEFATSRLTNAAHFRFVEDVYNRAAADEAVSTQALAQVGVLKKKVAAEDEALKTSQKNLTTDKIVAADKKQDSCYSGLRNAIKGYLTMPDGDMLEAAKVLSQSLKDYGIGVNDKLNDEAGKVENLLADMEGKYATQVELLALSPFVANLKAANQEVITLMNQRIDENSTRVAGAMKAAREASDTAYESLVSRVNALAVVDSEHDYEPFILKMNEHIKKMRQEARVRKPSTGGTDTTE